MKNNVNRKNINVDKKNVIPLWNFKQEDDTILKLALYKETIPFDITGQTIVLGAKRPNNTVIEQTDGFTISGNEIDITLKNNILAVNGLVELDLQITDVNGKLTTASFFIIVAKKVLGENNLNASNDISAINKVVNDLKSKEEQVNKVVNDIKPKADKLMNDIKSDYNSLQKIIIDENQAANLQDQINKSNEQLDSIATVIDFAKLESETWDEAINRLILEGNKILFLNHEYELYDTIILRNNTILELNDNTILTRKHGNNMFQTCYTNEVTEYNGVSNIIIRGGTLNHNGELSYNITMSLFHAKNILLENVTFKDISDHAIDLMGCNNVYINKCKFLGQLIKSGKEYKEAIQLDVCYAGASGYDENITPVNSKCYDGTPSTNIRIDNCIFDGSDKYPPILNAIGQHVQVKSNNKISNIKILNNTFNGDGRKDIYGNAIKLVQMEDVIIENNIINNYNRGIQVSIMPNMYDLDGTSVELNSSLVGCENIRICKNTINMPLITSPSRPIFIQTSSSLDQNNFRHKNIIIENNTINNKSEIENIFIGTLSLGKVSNNIIDGGTKGIYINANNDNVVTFNNTINNVSVTEIEIINEYENGNGRCELSFNKSIVIKNIDFAAGVTNYSSSQYITYSKNNGIVTLEGACTHEKYSGSNILLFTLPVGYRPLQDQSFLTIASGNGAMNRILVKKDGRVILQYTNSTGSTPFTCVGGISFLT